MRKTEIIVNSIFNFQRFPAHDHALRLLNHCIDLKREDIFVNSAFAILCELPNKKSKEVIFQKKKKLRI